MSRIVEAFLGNLAVAVIIWMLFCAILVAVFARDNAGKFLVGMLRIVASIVYSPFVFIRGAIQRIVRFADGETDFAGSEQYLLNRLMLTLQAIVIVIAVASLAAGGVTTWNALVPPQWTRDAVKRLSTELEATKTRAAEAEAAVSRADSEWAAAKQAAMNDYTASRQKTIKSAQAANAELVPLINAVGGNTVVIFNMVQGAAGAGDRDATARRVRQMESTVSSYYYYLDDMTRSRIRSWIVNWQRQQDLQYEIANVNESVVRAERHPDYSGLVEQKSRLASDVTSLKSQLDSAQEQAALRWGAALRTCIAAVISFIVLVWLLGIAVEAAWMLVRMADDVRKIREATPAQTAGPVVGAPLLPPDRLPVLSDAVAGGE